MRWLCYCSDWRVNSERRKSRRIGLYIELYWECWTIWLIVLRGGQGLLMLSSSSSQQPIFYRLGCWFPHALYACTLWSVALQGPVSRLSSEAWTSPKADFQLWPSWENLITAARAIGPQWSWFAVQGYDAMKFHFLTPLLWLIMCALT